MPLPGLVPPSSVPAFLLFGHDFQYQSPFGHVAMTTGHDRKRRNVTRRPTLANAALIMELDAAADWAVWVRDSLRNGQRTFSARVAQQGGPPVWYEAQLVQMYQWTGMHKGRKRADMQLRLIGDASTSGPAFGVFTSRSGLDVTGRARLTVIRNMYSRAGLEVT